MSPSQSRTHEQRVGHDVAPPDFEPQVRRHRQSGTDAERPEQHGLLRSADHGAPPRTQYIKYPHPGSAHRSYGGPKGQGRAATNGEETNEWWEEVHEKIPNAYQRASAKLVRTCAARGSSRAVLAGRIAHARAFRPLTPTARSGKAIAPPRFSCRAPTPRTHLEFAVDGARHLHLAVKGEDSGLAGGVKHLSEGDEGLETARVLRTQVAPFVIRPPRPF